MFHERISADTGEEKAEESAQSPLLSERLTAEMVGVFGESERSEPEVCRQRRPEMNTAGDQQFGGVKEEFRPEQLEWNISVNQGEPEHPYIKAEEEEVCIKEVEADITTVIVKREEYEVDLSGFKEENGEEERALEPARTSGPEGQFGPDHQQLLDTSSLNWEELENCDFNVKEEPDVVIVKSEENEEVGEFSQLHQRVTEDCGGPGLTRNFGADGHLGPGTEDETRSSETEDSDDWMVPFESPSLRTLKTNQTVDCKVRGNTCGKHSCPDYCKTHACKSSQLKQVNTEYGQKSLNCSQCGKRFKQRRNLRLHERIHTAEKPFSCSECGKTFKEKGTLRKHEQIHSGERPFSCSQCGKRFKLKGNLRLHERIHTGERPFSCSQCGTGFMRKGDLRKHEKVHTDDKPFSCCQCGKEFKQIRYLKLHERIHTEEKPFSCSDCGKRFKEKDYLRKHERIHTGEKPFGCSVCGKQFTHKHNLRTHETIHKVRTEGEKPFGCSQCGKRFTHNSQLKAHEKYHLGERPFSCSECGKGFTQNSHLRAHEKRCGQRPFSCSQVW